jgi:hypothetical protein
VGAPTSADRRASRLTGQPAGQPVAKPEVKRAGKTVSNPAKKPVAAQTRTATRKPAGAPAKPSRAPAVTVERTPRRVWVVALLASMWAAGIGIAIIAVPIFSVWLTATGGETSWLVPLKDSGLAWVIAHDVSVRADSGTYSLLPLGLLFIWIGLLAHAGRWAARSAGVTTLRNAGALTAAAAACYALILSGVSSLSNSPDFRTSPTRAFGVGLFVGAVGLGWGALRGSGLMAELRSRMSPHARTMVRSAIAGTAALIGFGALAAAVSLGLNFEEAVGSQRLLEPGLVGGLALLLLGMGYAPVIIMWAVSYLVGAGVKLGGGVVISPFVAPSEPVQLPPFPILSAIPPDLGNLGMALPLTGIVAGMLMGTIIARRTERSVLARLSLVIGAVVMASITLSILARLAVGSLGEDRLVSIGPPSETVALLSGALLLLGAVPVALLIRPAFSDADHWDTTAYDARGHRFEQVKDRHV